MGGSPTVAHRSHSHSWHRSRSGAGLHVHGGNASIHQSLNVQDNRRVEINRTYAPQVTIVDSFNKEYHPMPDYREKTEEKKEQVIIHKYEPAAPSEPRRIVVEMPEYKAPEPPKERVIVVQQPEIKVEQPAPQQNDNSAWWLFGAGAAGAAVALALRRFFKKDDFQTGFRKDQDRYYR